MIKRPNILRRLAECRNVVTVVAASMVMAGGPVRAQLLNSDPIWTEAVRLYGDPVISANPDLVNSTSNDAGLWGSSASVVSFHNEYGPLGSPDFVYSTGNEYGQGVEVRFSEEALEQVAGLKVAVEMYGAPILSDNPDLVNSTSNPYGPWGSPDAVYSFTNEYGPVGSRDAGQGVNNEYGTGLKIQLIDPMPGLDAP